MKLFVAVLFVLVSGATAKVIFVGWSSGTRSRNPEVWGYDPANGTGEDDIRKNFNLHRGRWWNYYERGSWYLAYGHYKAAKSDFIEVVKKRPTDKRDCRTYGMHFRDCFAHRELGIILYYQAIQVETKADRLFLLDESVAELNKSLNQAESSRAKFFLNLAEENRWEAKEEVDTTAPAITVENATRAGENWALVFCNRRTVQLDIRVTDDQSGVGAIWVNEEKVFVERSAPTIRKTVHVPVDTDNIWIPVRARDLVGNGSPTILVRVELDMRPPIIFATAHPEQTTPDALIPVRYSVRDDLGLSTIQVDDQKIDCNGRLEYDMVVRVPAEPDSSRLELRATDLAGNTTKCFVDLLPRGSLTLKHINPASWFARSTYFNRGLWATHSWQRALPTFLRDNTFGLALRAPAHYRQDMYFSSQLMLAMRGAAPLAIHTGRYPVFEFDNYEEVEGGYRVRGDQYWIEGRLKYATGVTGIDIGENTLPFEPNYDENVVFGFGSLVSLPDYGEKKIEVRALYADGHTVRHIKPLVVRRVPDPTAEPNCVYSVVVLPLKQKYVPGNSQGEHGTPEMRYAKIKQAIKDCKMYDSNVGEPIPRFDCKVMENLDPNKIEDELDRLEVPESSSHHYKIVTLGQALRKRKHRVELGIHGWVKETPKNFEVKLDVADMAGGELIILSHPIDIFVEKTKRDWKEECVKGLISKLLTEIPRISGEVTSKSDDRFKSITVDRGEDDKLFLGASLLVFKKDEHRGNVPERLVEATVSTLEKRRSRAEVVESKSEGSLLVKVKKGQMFITK
jgi:hypothetical protein